MKSDNNENPYVDLIQTYLEKFCSEEINIAFQDGEIEWLIGKINKAQNVLVEAAAEAVAMIHTDPALISQFVMAKSKYPFVRSTTVASGPGNPIGSFSKIITEDTSKQIASYISDKLQKDSTLKEVDILNSLVDKGKNTLNDILTEYNNKVIEYIDKNSAYGHSNGHKIFNLLSGIVPPLSESFQTSVPIITAVIANNSRYIVYLNMDPYNLEYTGSYAYTPVFKLVIKSKNSISNRKKEISFNYDKEDVEAIEGAKLLIKDAANEVKSNFNAFDLEVLGNCLEGRDCDLTEQDFNEINNAEEDNIILIKRTYRQGFRHKTDDEQDKNKYSIKKITENNLLVNNIVTNHRLKDHAIIVDSSRSIERLGSYDDLVKKIYLFFTTTSDSYFRTYQTVNIANGMLSKINNYAGLTISEEDADSLVAELFKITNINYSNYLFIFRDIKNVIKSFIHKMKDHSSVVNTQIIEDFSTEDLKKNYLSKAPDWKLFTEPRNNSIYIGMFAANHTITEIFSYLMDKMVADLIKSCPFFDERGQPVKIDLMKKSLDPSDVCYSFKSKEGKILYRITQVGTCTRRQGRTISTRIAVLEPSPEIKAKNIIIVFNDTYNIYNLIDKNRIVIGNRKNRGRWEENDTNIISMLEFVSDMESFDQLCKGKDAEAIRAMVDTLSTATQADVSHSVDTNNGNYQATMYGYQITTKHGDNRHTGNNTWICDPEKLTLHSAPVNKTESWKKIKGNADLSEHYRTRYDVGALSGLRTRGYERNDLSYFGHAFVAAPFIRTVNIAYDSVRKYSAMAIEAYEEIRYPEIAVTTITSRSHEAFVETVIRNRIGNSRVESIKNSIPIAFYRGLNRLMLTGKSFKISSSISSDPIEISNEGIKFNDQVLSASNMMTTIPMPLMAMAVWRETGSSFKHLPGMFKQKTEEMTFSASNVEKIIKKTDPNINRDLFVNVMFMPLLNFSGIEEYKWESTAEKASLRNLADVYNSASNIAFRALNLGTIHKKTTGSYLGDRFVLNYVNNSFMDLETNTMMTFNISEPQDIDFNRFADIFCYKLCAPFSDTNSFNWYMECIDSFVNWDERDQFELFNCTIGMVKAKVSIGRPNARGGRLCYINGKRLRREELKTVLRNALCFDTQDAYDTFVAQVSQLSFRARGLIKKGLRVSVVKGNRTSIQFFLEFDKIDSEWVMWIRDGSGQALEKLRVKDINPAINAFWSISSQRGDYQMAVGAFSKFITNVCDINLSQLSKIHLYGMKSFNERVARSRKFLEDTVQKTGAEYTTGPGTNIVGYKVKGKSGKEYMVACSKDLRVVSDDPFRNDHGTNDFGAVYSYPAMEYVCIVDKSRDQSGYDVIAGRLLALRNDLHLVDKINTLAKHVN